MKNTKILFALLTLALFLFQACTQDDLPAPSHKPVDTLRVCVRVLNCADAATGEVHLVIGATGEPQVLSHSPNFGTVPAKVRFPWAHASYVFDQSVPIQVSGGDDTCFPVDLTYTQPGFMGKSLQNDPKVLSAEELDGIYLKYLELGFDIGEFQVVTGTLGYFPEDLSVRKLTFTPMNVTGERLGVLSPKGASFDFDSATAHLTFECATQH